MTRMTGKKLSLMIRESLQRLSQRMKKMREREKKSMVKVMDHLHNQTMAQLFPLRENNPILLQQRTLRMSLLASQQCPKSSLALAHSSQ
jgi:hypothetical protein